MVCGLPTGGVTFPASNRPCPEDHAWSSKPTWLQAVPRFAPEALYFQGPPIWIGRELVTTKGVMAKLRRPGVPPTNALTAQFADKALAVSSSRLAKETPEPSGPTGQSPSTREESLS